MINKIASWCWPFPKFGWEHLDFADRLKLFAFYTQAGAGMAMTAFSVAVLWWLKDQGERAIWPMFYLGAMAMVLIGIIVTGLAGLLIKRTVEAKIGPVEFKTSDIETAKALTAAATTQITTPAAPASDEVR